MQYDWTNIFTKECPEPLLPRVYSVRSSANGLAYLNLSSSRVVATSLEPNYVSFMIVLLSLAWGLLQSGDVDFPNLSLIEMRRWVRVVSGIITTWAFMDVYETRNTDKRIKLCRRFKSSQEYIKHGQMKTQTIINATYPKPLVLILERNCTWISIHCVKSATSYVMLCHFHGYRPLLE